ncbi:hypothetical protein L2E82_30756 [Cichorium intybus]|uniref:Uncharacterized protein n=1 Tax=Cichorium intybus TaxID=13427 RepID=A0ACB9D1P4_CICIN|nr:hypothetical protein L2E82_30756 [Cichorium intybus]
MLGSDDWLKLHRYLLLVLLQTRCYTTASALSGSKNSPSDLVFYYVAYRRNQSTAPLFPARTTTSSALYDDDDDEEGDVCRICRNPLHHRFLLLRF